MITVDAVETHVIVEGIGLRDPFYRPGYDGGVCGLLPGGPLKISVFGVNDAEAKEPEMQLGLLTLNRSIFLVGKLGDLHLDMPYLHKTGQEVPNVEACMGLTTVVSLCDCSGVCRSMRLGPLTHNFTSAFLDGARDQVSSGLTNAEHERNIRSAYRRWADNKTMFSATPIRDIHWTTD